PVEGAQPLERGSRLLEGDGLADDIDDRQLALDFGSGADRQTRAPLVRDPDPFRLLRVPPAWDPNMAVGLSSLDKPGGTGMYTSRHPFVKHLSILPGGIKRQNAALRSAPCWSQAASTNRSSTSAQPCG